MSGLSEDKGELKTRLLNFLTGGQSVVVATASKAGEPHAAIMTWVVARPDGTLAIAMDSRATPFRNLQENPRIALEVLGDDLVLLVRGRARVFKEKIEASPFPSVGVLVEIEEVRDQGAAGVLFKGPSYSFTEGKEHRRQVEAEIFAELRQT